MPLINLDRICEVNGQAGIFHVEIEPFLLGKKRQPHLTDNLVVYIMQLKTQAANLVDRLTFLHQHCTDFASGNLQPYIDEHNGYWEGDPEEYEEPFVEYDPFHALERFFNKDWIGDLPERIEEYGALCEFMPQYLRMVNVQREGFHTMFPNAKVSYLIADEQGETTVVPEGELPPDFINKVEANREIRLIETEYCLDGYNEFYRIAKSLIVKYRALGDIVGCATEILKLFAPYKNPNKHPMAP